MLVESQLTVMETAVHLNLSEGDNYSVLDPHCLFVAWFACASLSYS